MKTRLMLKSALLVMSLALVSCGSADKLSNDNKGDVAKVVVARAMMDSNGKNTGKVEIALMSKEDAASQEKIEANFNKGVRKSFDEFKKDMSSSDQCFGCNNYVSAPAFPSIYANEFGRCGSIGGCFWFPGKHALRLAGRIVGGALRGVGNTIDYIWNGPRAIMGYQNNQLGVWNNAIVSYRDQGCSSYECSRFWTPSVQPCYAQPFVSGNYGYAVYEETTYEHVKSVNMPGYSEYLNESSHTITRR